MLRIIVIALIAVIAVGAGYWGYEEHQEKNAILIHAENNYQRAFHDLTYQIDLLQDKIGTTLAMNSRDSLSPSLAEVWRITSEAHNDVGQLPLALLPFNKTEEFLQKIGEFSYRTAVRDLDKKPLSDDEYATLQQLYQNASDIQQELRKVQHLVIENNLRWMDVELALANQDQQMDNTIIDGFKTVEKDVEGYSESDFGVSFTSMSKEDENFGKLPGEAISEKEAVQRAKRFLDIKDASNVKVVENDGGGSDNGFYSVSIKEGKTDVDLDITKKGGHPIWILRNREVEDQKISLNKASIIASKFLKDREFESMDLFESSQYDNIGVFTFVSKHDDVRIYPEAVRVKVALDNGDIIGLSARAYLMAHHDRKLPEPKLDRKAALEKVNPKVKVMETRLAVMENDVGEEVMTYEILGTINKSTYRIFINADNGKEEKVEKLQKSEAVYNNV